MSSGRVAQLEATRAKPAFHFDGPSAASAANGDVRFGSSADIQGADRPVRFTPKSGHAQSRQRCRLSANSGHRGPLHCGSRGLKLLKKSGSVGNRHHGHVVVLRAPEPSPSRKQVAGDPECWFGQRQYHVPVRNFRPGIHGNLFDLHQMTRCLGEAHWRHPSALKPESGGG